MEKSVHSGKKFPNTLLSLKYVVTLHKFVVKMNHWQIRDKRYRHPDVFHPETGYLLSFHQKAYLFFG